MKAEKAIDHARKAAEYLERKHGGRAVWMGKNKFIIVKNGATIETQFNAREARNEKQYTGN